MAPPSGTRISGRIMAAASSAPTMTKARKTTKTKPRRKSYKKCPVQQQKNNNSTIQEPIIPDDMMPSNSSTTTIEDIPKINELEFESTVDHSCSSACSTPKAERFRIPEIVTCPPAPKKQRVLSNCSVKRSPISFFPHLDLEMFFVYASRNTSF